MNVQIKDGNVIITMPLDPTGKPSASGKSIVHATTGGNKEVTVDGKNYVLGVNFYSKKA